MSRRKHLLQSLEQEVEPPGEGQHIVRAAGSRGSNIIEVEFPDGRSTLCLLPAKFHKKLWVRKGSFLVVEDAPAAGEEGSRVTGQIVAVLYADHVKQLRRMPGVWPPEFEASSSGATAADQAAEQLAALGVAESDDEGSAAAAAGSRTAAAAAAAAAAGSAGQRDGAEGEGAAGASAAASSTVTGGEGEEASGGGYSSSSEDDLPPIPRFNNRKVIEYEVSDSEDESD